MKFLDPDHPFFAKPWRRWATAVVPLAIGAYDLMNGDFVWALLFGGLGGYALWVLILNRPQG